DYLQRIGVTQTSVPSDVQKTTAPVSMRRVYHIKGIGRDEKRPMPSANRDQKVRMPSEDLLMGMYGYKIPLSFAIWAEQAGVTIHLGTWAAEGRKDIPAETLDERQEILRAALNSLYPLVEVSSVDPRSANVSYPLAGVALGIPTVK